MLKIEINATIWDAEVKDYMLIITTSEGYLTMYGHHDQDCCEDVDIDWDEIPSFELKKLEGIRCEDLEIKKDKEGGFLLKFITNKVDKDWEELTGQKEYEIYSILVGCHNIQNGYYSDLLDLVVNWNNKEHILEELEFTNNWIL